MTQRCKVLHVYTHLLIRFRRMLLRYVRMAHKPSVCRL